MADVLVLQNTKVEGLGALAGLLQEDGFSVDLVLPRQQKIPEGDYRFGIILGGPQSANDDHSYLREEVALIRKFVQDDIPILGICLGSQLIAKAFGAKVYPGPKKEIGFYSDLHLDSSSSLFEGFDDPFTVFHWHGETFELPKGATRLASSEIYPNQAIRIGSAVGIQFHLEVDSQMVYRWLDNAAEDLKKIPYVDVKKIQDETPEKIPAVYKNMTKFYKNFKSEFRM